ncbi:MAG: 6-hydroxymethylpterin diphosphokinase MptE-like protein [Spirochaetaceae bacterium]|nr:DUF115 domain-containing protein [Spirochaetaceae bacterium]MDT8297315.1 6-hydroxymethylpterin diphosphokinase MptE-like protein [Spirochaetaceae bacterium]
MSESGILDRNLVALSTRQPDLASRLSGSTPDENLSFIESRIGLPVPILPRDGRPFPMHSRFDPILEGQKLADGSPEGYLVAFGLGGGYHLKPLLEKKTLTGLIIVERSLPLVRGFMERIDLTRLLSDSRVILLIDPLPGELTRVILDRYLPVLYGNLGSITLRSRWDADPSWFGDLADSLKGIPEALGRDYTVQARFGRRWLVHTMANLPRSEVVGAVLPPSRRLLITAAGPSLEGQLSKIHSLQARGAALLATDTSLPLLASAGLVPDMVLSIDCQVVSYHHFLKGLPKKTLLMLDLASPPALTRLTDRTLFFSSGHPFSLYLNRLYRPFPILDISGGNVTHAAASLAQAAGAEEVHLFGADFSYPMGRPYAKETYIFPYFQSRSDRISSSENLFWKFIADSRPRRERSEDSWRFRTSSMDHYREALEDALGDMSFRLIQESGEGVPIELSAKANAPKLIRDRHVFPMLTAGPVTVGWKDFLQDYRRRLENLPSLSGPPQDYLEELEPENRQAWATLLPSAATFRSESPDGPAAVEKARQWTLGRIDNLRRIYSDPQITAP